MISAVYAISFIGSEKAYIGSSVDLKRRLKSHLSLLRKGRHHSIALQRASDKYGCENLTLQVLEVVSDKSNLIAIEQVWIDTYDGRRLNCSPSAQSRLGSRMPDTARAAISASLQGNKYRQGIPHDEETKARISSSVVAANTAGRRKPGRNCPENFNGFLGDLRSGRRPHPKSNPERDAAIAKAHMESGSLKKTGAMFELTPCAVWHVVKRVAPQQLRKWIRKCKNT